MTTLNDAKYNKLITLVTPATIDDMELAWLKTQGATSDHINDAWFEVTGGPTITDGKYAYFAANGGIGNDINALEKTFWENL